METASKTHGVWLGRGRRGRVQARESPWCAEYSRRGRPGARHSRAQVGKERPSKLNVPAELTGQWEMGVVSCS